MRSINMVFRESNHPGLAASEEKTKFALNLSATNFMPWP